MFSLYSDGRLESFDLGSTKSHQRTIDNQLCADYEAGYPGLELG